MARWGDACCHLITEMHNKYSAKAKKETDGKINKEGGEGKEEMRSVSTHTVTVISIGRSVQVPCAPQKPEQVLLQQRGSETLFSQKMESQLAYTHTQQFWGERGTDWWPQSPQQKDVMSPLRWLWDGFHRCYPSGCRLAPKGRSSDQAGENAEQWRNLQRACSAQEALVFFLCSQISSITSDSILKAQHHSSLLWMLLLWGGHTDELLVGLSTLLNGDWVSGWRESLWKEATKTQSCKNSSL